MTVSINKVSNVEHGVESKQKLESRSGERRQAADRWSYLLKGLASVSWCFFCIALIVSYNADHVFVNEHSSLMFLANNLYVVLWISAFTSYLCLIIAKYRSRRKRDSKHIHVIMLLVCAFIWSSYILGTL